MAHSIFLEESTDPMEILAIDDKSVFDLIKKIPKLRNELQNVYHLIQEFLILEQKEVLFLTLSELLKSNKL